MRRVRPSALFLCVLPVTGWAAGPYVVDDAELVDAKKVQVESWYGTTHGRHYAVLNPAYQVVPDLELSVQITHDRQSDDRTDSIAPQLKYQWHKNDQPGGFDSVVEAGMSYDLDPDRVPFMFAMLPLTYHASREVDFHVNLGVQSNIDDHRTTPIVGVGAEYQVTEMVAMRGETFRAPDARIGAQAGPHVQLTSAIELDLLYGYHVAADAGHLLTAGATFTF